MRVVVTGASGLIGSAVLDALDERGDEAVAFRRGVGSGGWDIAARHVDRAVLEGADAVVHLAGESIGGWWTSGKKRRILDSRVDGTALISAAIADVGVPVAVIGSAIGFYGDRGDEELTERSQRGRGFLSDVVEAWERAATPATSSATRVAFARSALVIDGARGSLPRMLLPFRVGLGGRIGSGRQYWSWITLADEVRAILHLLDADLEGPVNLAAPHPVRNVEFVAELGRALRRPTMIPVPGFGLKLALSPEFAEEVLLASQRVLPEALERSGFEFSHPDLASAFGAVL